MTAQTKNRAFGAELQRLRLREGWSQRQLLEKIQLDWPELSLDTLGRIEREGSLAKHRPILGAVNRIFSRADADRLSRIFNGEDPQQPDDSDLHICLLLVADRPALSRSSLEELVWGSGLVPLFTDPKTPDEEFDRRASLANCLVVLGPGSPRVRALRKRSEAVGLPTCLVVRKGEVGARLLPNEHRLVYGDRDGLISGLAATLTSLRANPAAVRWTRRIPGLPSGTTAGGSIAYQLQEISWRFSPSEHDDDAGYWDAKYRIRRVMAGLHPDGLGRIETTFHRVTGAPFTAADHPTLRLIEGFRESAGDIEMGPPWWSEDGMRFEQHANLVPRSNQGEWVDTLIAGELPRFKFAYRQDAAAASMNDTAEGPRNTDWCKRPINFPTDRFVMSAFLPMELRVKPVGPRVTRATYRDSLHEEHLRDTDAYSCTKKVLDGVEGWLMKLDVRSPITKSSYYLEWLPPSRDE